MLVRGLALSLALTPGLWLLAADTGHAQFVAEEVTAGNAATHLFSGTDADGGIGDWYLSNGVIEAIVDEVGLQTVPAGATAPPKQSEAAFTGGSVIDLGLVGADNDQLSQLFTVGGLSTSNFILYDSIGGSTTASSATLTLTGTLLGFDPPVSPDDLDVVTEYSVAGTDNFMTIKTTVTNNSGDTAPGLSGLLDAIIWTQRAITPFSPLVNRGFNHPALDLANPFPSIEVPIFAAGPGNINPGHGVIDPPSGKTAGEVSYGLLGVEISIDQDGAGGSPPTVNPVNRLFGISSNLVTAFGNVPGGSLSPGGILIYTRRLYVGDSNDVASVSNDMITELSSRLGFSTGTISGNIDGLDTLDVPASVVVTRTAGPAIPALPNGSAMTHFRTKESGLFTVGLFTDIVLPEGTYDLEVRSEQRDPVTVTGVVVSAGADTEVDVPPLTPTFGSIELNVFERVRGEPNPDVPARVTLFGIDVPDPTFNRDFEAFIIESDSSLTDIMPETFPGGPAQKNFVYLADGTITVKLRPGKYEAFASRGPEYTLKRKKFRVRPGKAKRRRFKLKRIVETPDAISADFHIHSARSFDASAGLRDRVASFAGENVEVMISTDHDYHTDYAPIITSLGLDTFISSQPGNEVTGSVPNPPAFPDATGHINAWPLPIDPDARRDGSIEDEFVAPNLLFSRLRGQGAEVVQYNHPRAGVSGLTAIGFFNNIGYDPDTVITAPPNDLLLDDDVLGPGISSVANPDGYRNIDFDVMEIANGVGVEDYLEVRRDWFSLLNQTDGTTVPFIPGTGVSDSHRITLETAGYARTYVLGVGDDPSAVPVSTFNTNVRAGKMMATTGPFIEFSVEDTGGASVGLGETLVPTGSDVILDIRVQSTNWIPIEEVRIYRNGFLEQTFDENTSPAVEGLPKKPWSQRRTRTVRFSARVPINLAADSYFVVEAGAAISPLPDPPEFIDKIVPGMIPLGFTNPIFVDLGGDGFDPPGLPVMAASVAPLRFKEGTPSLEGLSEHKRKEVLAHFPIHKITIPASAADALR